MFYSRGSLPFHRVRFSYRHDSQTNSVDSGATRALNREIGQRANRSQDVRRLSILGFRNGHHEPNRRIQVSEHVLSLSTQQCLQRNNSYTYKSWFIIKIGHFTCPLKQHAFPCSKMFMRKSFPVKPGTILFCAFCEEGCSKKFWPNITYMF